jgi:hypothetical protein
VGADDLAGLLEGLELFTPDAALLGLREPGLDEGLALGVAVAAAAVADAVLGQPGPEGAAGERRAVVGAQRQLARPDAALGDGAVDDRGRLVGAAADVERPAGDLAGAAVDRGVSDNTSRARRPRPRSYPDARAHPGG